jgi:hypothetical protein
MPGTGMNVSDAIDDQRAEQEQQTLPQLRVRGRHR